MQLHRNAARIAALCVAALVPLAGVVAVAPPAAGAVSAPAANPAPAATPAPTAKKKKKKKQQTMIAIGSRLAKGSSTGPSGAFIGMTTAVGYTCLSPNGKKTYSNSYVRSTFTETTFAVTALDNVTKKTKKKWTCTVSMTKPSWEPAGGKWDVPTWHKGKDRTTTTSAGTGWTITVKAPQGKVTYVRAMNNYTGKGAKYKPKIVKVPDIWANSSLGGA